jgi:hypothetical protein
MRNTTSLLVGLMLAAVRPGMAQPEATTTNMRAYQLLAGRIGDSLNAEIPARDTSRVFLSVKPEASAWLVQGDISEAIRKGGHTVVVAMPAAFQADLGILDMRVSYRNPRTEGMFTGKVVDREVALSIEARLVDQRSGVVTLTREFREALRDTVSISAVPTLEDMNVPVTQGTLPGEGFFSSLVEPLVMLGAIAVAVYLLFTVRS